MSEALYSNVHEKKIKHFCRHNPAGLLWIYLLQLLCKSFESETRKRHAKKTTAGTLAKTKKGDVFIFFFF